MKRKQTEEKLVSISQAHDGNILIIEGAVNGTSLRLILTTKASRTAVSSQLAIRLLLNSTIRYDHCNLVITSGQHIPALNEKRVELQLSNSIYQQKLIAADIVDNCILGLDFMRQHSWKIGWSSMGICWSIGW